jgi:biopolymer transport protein ExbD
MKNLNIKINILLCICVVLIILSVAIPAIAQSIQPEHPTTQAGNSLTSDPLGTSTVGILIAGLIWVLKTSILDNNKVIGAIPQILEANRVLLDKLDNRLVAVEKTVDDNKEALDRNTETNKHTHEELKAALDRNTDAQKSLHEDLKKMLQNFSGK